MIHECEGYKSLLAAIEKDDRSGWSLAERMKKLEFAVSRAQHYESKTGISASEILTAWEKRRRYWYMNYYQDAEQPLIDGERVRVFENAKDLMGQIGNEGFRCPSCGKVTMNPYECDQEPCDWKVYGLFRDLGKGVYVFSKEDMRGELLFMPLAWEKQPVEESSTGRKEDE